MALCWAFLSLSPSLRSVFLPRPFSRLPRIGADGESGGGGGRRGTPQIPDRLSVHLPAAPSLRSSTGRGARRVHPKSTAIEKRDKAYVLPTLSSPGG